MKNNRILFFTFLTCILLFTFSGSVFGQEDQPEDWVVVEMVDGSRFVGKKLALNGETLILETLSAGKLNLPVANIKTITDINKSSIKNGVYWPENINASRNLIGQTGYGLRKNQGYYQNYMLFFNQFNYGFSDRFSIGFGFEIFSLLASASFESDPIFPGFIITPKFSIPIQEDNLNLGIGTTFVHVPSSDSFIDLAIVNGALTIGSRDKNLTVGVGWGYADGEFSSQPVITLAGNIRLSRRFGLLSENWIVPSANVAILTLGFRVIGERITWDFAFVGATADGDGGISPIPFVGVSIPLGKW